MNGTHCAQTQVTEFSASPDNPRAGSRGIGDGSVLGQYWDSTLTVLGHYLDSTLTVL